jgi:hypothetical protein
MPIAINGSGTITGVSVGGLPDGIVDADMIAADAVTDAKQSLSGAAKAWVNFQGDGTVAIRDNFNVSSITDNNTGDYTVNFTTALANANYCISGMAMNSNNFIAINSSTNPATSSVRVSVRNYDGSGEDGNYVCVAIHGD